MEPGDRTIAKQKNSDLSVVLITVNIFLLFVLAFSGNEEDNELYIFVLALGLNVLLGVYAFSYHGKGYRIGKWIFGIVLIITLIIFGFLWYVWQLGKGFSH